MKIKHFSNGKFEYELSNLASKPMKVNDLFRTRMNKLNSILKHSHITSL